MKGNKKSVVTGKTTFKIGPPMLEFKTLVEGMSYVENDYQA
jgi:hypothetical protein